MNIKLLIIEDNKSTLKILKEYLNNERGFSVIGAVDNGIDGLKLIESELPDVVLMDIMLPGKDGIAILEELKRLDLIKNPVHCIILTAIASEDVTVKAFNLGAEYVMIKPYNIKDLVRRIKDISFIKDETRNEINREANSNVGNKLERKVTNVLNEIGIVSSLKGYKYLKSAVVLGFNNENILDSVTKGLYPEIAKESATSPTRVERAIRHAIEIAWKRCDAGTAYERMGFSSLKNGKRPTNSEFIYAVIEYIKLNI